MEWERQIIIILTTAGARTLAALATLLAGYVVITLLRGSLGRALRAARAEPAVSGLALALISAAAWVIVAASTLKALGLSEIALAVSGSISLLALAIANAGSTLTQDLIAGLFLVRDRDFKVGFKVNAAGLTGTVTAIDIRKTRVVTPEGQTVVIPNSKVETAPWTVLERPGKS